MDKAGVNAFEILSHPFLLLLYGFSFLVHLLLSLFPLSSLIVSATMETGSPRKIQFTVPLLDTHLDPEAAEQVRRKGRGNNERVRKRGREEVWAGTLDICFFYALSLGGWIKSTAFLIMKKKYPEMRNTLHHMFECLSNSA